MPVSYNTVDTSIKAISKSGEKESTWKMPLLIETGPRCYLAAYKLVFQMGKLCHRVSGHTSLWSWIWSLHICRNHSLSPKNGSKCLKLVLQMGLKKWNTTGKFPPGKDYCPDVQGFFGHFPLEQTKSRVSFTFQLLGNGKQSPYPSSIYFIIIFLSIYYHTIFRQGNIQGNHPNHFR